jgi:hypothetical protein
MSNVAASSPCSADKPEKAAGSPEVSALRPSLAGAVSGYCVGIAVKGEVLGGLQTHEPHGASHRIISELFLLMQRAVSAAIG